MEADYLKIVRVNRLPMTTDLAWFDINLISYDVIRLAAWAGNFITCMKPSGKLSLVLS